jgi:hypothetical protein
LLRRPLEFARYIGNIKDAIIARINDGQQMVRRQHRTKTPVTAE